MDLNIATFLAQDADWRAVEADLVTALNDIETVDPAGSQELLRSARHEVEACDAIWEGDIGRALERSRAVIDALRGGKAPQRFAALWHYLAASWASRLHTTTGDDTYRSAAEEHYRQARRAGRGTTWLTHLASPADRSVAPATPTVDPVDQAAAEQILRLVKENSFTDGFEAHTSRVRAGLEPSEGRLRTSARRDGPPSRFLQRSRGRRSHCRP